MRTAGQNRRRPSERVIPCVNCGSPACEWPGRCDPGASKRPPYSRDGRLQLCSACNRYVSRYRNTCPRDDCPDNAIRDRLVAK